ISTWRRNNWSRFPTRRRCRRRASAPSVRSTMTEYALKGHWIDEWNPEDETSWEASGKRIARKNLAFSIFAEHLGFSIWVLWTIIVINLSNVGIVLSLPEQFWLTAVPNLVGSTLR